MSKTPNQTIPPTNRRKLVRERRGAMLVFIAVAGVVLMGFLAMTLDLGSGSRQRRIAQTAADAAAIGGGQEIFRNRPDLVPGSAVAEAVRNGFTAGETTVYFPPATGPYAGNTQYVEVIINKPTPTIFGSIFNVSSMNVQARGVAGVASYALNCVYSLDPTAASGLEVENGGELNTNCGVAINSSSSSGLELNSSGKVVATGSSIGVVGNYNGGGGSVASPTPITGMIPLPNPLTGVTMPTVGPCTNATPLVVSGTQTISQGVYCGGITVGAGGGGGGNKLILNPGVYILAGGGLTVESGGEIVGDGVTIINTTGSYAFKPFDFGTGCKARLTAPTSGTWKGIVLYQDPAAPSTPSSTFACASDDGNELTGTLYLPNSTITFDGSNSGTSILGSVIALQVIVSGKVDIINDTSGNNAAKRLSLVQ